MIRVALLSERGYKPLEFPNVLYPPINTDLRLEAERNEQIRVQRTYNDEVDVWAQTMFEGWSESSLCLSVSVVNYCLGKNEHRDTEAPTTAHGSESTLMKIPLKYGLLTALGLIVWVLVTHLLLTNQQSLVITLGGPIFFNVLHFVMIYLGIKALEREKGEKPEFKEAVKTGVSIAFVFALAATLFFVCVVLAVGTKWMAGEPAAGATPARTLMIQAFAGLFIGTIIFGLIYSTVISFFVARRRSEQT